MINIRITIVGTHGTGKTSLAKHLAQELNLPLIEEQARLSLEKLKLPHLDITRYDNDYFSPFQQDVLRRQINIEYKYQNGFVSDRSTCDNYCYYKLNTKDCPEIVNMYEKLALTHYTNSYDLVFYVPIMFELEDDGVRNRGKEYQKLVDEEIQKYLHLNPNCYIVKSNRIKNRVRECVKYIETIRN